jgi:hypothetical protein
VFWYALQYQKILSKSTIINDDNLPLKHFQNRITAFYKFLNLNEVIDKNDITEISVFMNKYMNQLFNINQFFPLQKVCAYYKQMIILKNILCNKSNDKQTIEQEILPLKLILLNYINQFLDKIHKIRQEIIQSNIQNLENQHYQIYEVIFHKTRELSQYKYLFCGYMRRYHHSILDDSDKKILCAMVEQCTKQHISFFNYLKYVLFIQQAVLYKITHITTEHSNNNCNDQDKSLIQNINMCRSDNVFKELSDAKNSNEYEKITNKLIEELNSLFNEYIKYLQKKTSLDQDIIKNCQLKLEQYIIKTIQYEYFLKKPYGFNYHLYIKKNYTLPQVKTTPYKYRLKRHFTLHKYHHSILNDNDQQILLIIIEQCKQQQINLLDYIKYILIIQHIILYKSTQWKINNLPDNPHTQLQNMKYETVTQRMARPSRNVFKELSNACDNDTYVKIQHRLITELNNIFTKEMAHLQKKTSLDQDIIKNFQLKLEQYIIKTIQSQYFFKQPYGFNYDLYIRNNNIQQQQVENNNLYDLEWWSDYIAQQTLDHLNDLDTENFKYTRMQQWLND